MIQKYEMDFEHGMQPSDMGDYVRYSDHLTAIENLKTSKDYMKWFRALFPHHDLMLEINEEAGDNYATLHANHSGICAQVSGTQEQWESKDGRANMVQWLCKALMTGLLNKAME